MGPSRNACPTTDNLYRAAYQRTGQGVARTTREHRFRIFAEALHDLFRAEKQTERRGLRKRARKLLLQGKGIEEFVSFELEPKILGEARLGYEEVHAPEMFEPHFGIDESGKGDFFGPLVIAGAFTDRAIARSFWTRNSGQQADRVRREDSVAREDDSANAGRRDRRRADRPGEIQRSLRKVWQSQQPPRLGSRSGDRKPARKKPDCPRALSDKFADARVIEKALLQHGRHIELEQRTKAESDFAVAAASILAREAFIDWLERNGKTNRADAWTRCFRLSEGDSTRGRRERRSRRVAAFRQGPFPHRARDRAGSLSPRPRRGGRGGSSGHKNLRIGRVPARFAASFLLLSSPFLVETRLLILNSDPVFQDRALAMFDAMRKVEIRIVRTLAEAVCILMREDFDLFIVEGEAAVAIEQAIHTRQHFPSLKIVCLPQGTELNAARSGERTEHSNWSRPTAAIAVFAASCVRSYPPLNEPLARPPRGLILAIRWLATSTNFPPRRFCK